MIMKFKSLLLASMLFYSCNNSDYEIISLYSFLPEDSSVIVNINNLENTKEILENNKLLPSVLSSTQEISTQLNLLSKKTIGLNKPLEEIENDLKFQSEALIKTRKKLPKKRTSNSNSMNPLQRR